MVLAPDCILQLQGSADQQANLSQPWSQAHEMAM